jgi:shikimate kinase
MRHLKSISKVVHIRVPFEVIEDRLKNLPPRAIIGLGKKSLRELYDERMPLYEAAADLTVEAKGGDSDIVATKIIEYIA